MGLSSGVGSNRWRPQVVALQVLAAMAVVVLFLAWVTTTNQGWRHEEDSSLPLEASLASFDTASSTPKWARITSQGNPARISKDAPKSVGGIHRIVLATVPRTGNGWMRGLLEAATGVATESIFKEGVQSVFNERSQAFGKGCGWLEDCNLVRVSAGVDPVIVKTHFPFTTSAVNVSQMLAENRPDTGLASYVIASVRNPLDNHDAWVRYQQEKVAEEERLYMDLPSFMEAWVIHHTFWHHLRVPMFVYRYEDLLSTPILILRTILKYSGLWDYYHLSDVELARVAGLPRLQTFKSKRFGAATRHKDDIAHAYRKYEPEDIEWLLSNYGWILERFGYKEMYEVWLSAAQGQLTDDNQIAVQVQRAMTKTARRANWGDVYIFDDEYFGL